jgi:hypothetical protein
MCAADLGSFGSILCLCENKLAKIVTLLFVACYFFLFVPVSHAVQTSREFAPYFAA